MSQLNDDELKKLVESNARAIEALANTMAENERKSEEERVNSRKEMSEFRETVANAIENLSHAVAHLDNSLARVAISQGEIASNTYRAINRMEKRQDDIVDILKLLTEKLADKKSEE